MPILPHPITTYEELLAECAQHDASLLAVSKTKSEKEILQLYKKGQKVFGENRAQELVVKASLLPSDIEWHLIGHLQTNKVQPILPFVTCIQSLDSWKLWQKIQEEATQAEIRVSCFLQIRIATEETKFGWEMDVLESVLKTNEFRNLSNVSIGGVMGMASLTADKEQIRNEFKKLKSHYDYLKAAYFEDSPEFKTLSMGMSGDYHIALEEGSSMVRIGSLLFG